MADVFISYCTEDRPKAALIGIKLTELGFSVWWDRNLILGADYWDQIESELEASKAVVVLWSSDSVKSPWVKAEANRGTRGDRLLPVVLDECIIPLRFEILQAADLRGWRGGNEHPEWQKLLQKLFLLAPKSAAPRRVNDSTIRTTVNGDDLLGRVEKRVSEFLAEARQASANRLFPVLREFPEFTNAQNAKELWFGLGTKEKFFQKLCLLNPKLEAAPNAEGVLVLGLKGAQKPTVAEENAAIEVALPSVEDMGRFVVDLGERSPQPVPLAHVANAIEAEFGERVRKSAWLGKGSLKQLLLPLIKGGGLEISSGTGYLYDPRRHMNPH